MDSCIVPRDYLAVFPDVCAVLRISFHLPLLSVFLRFSVRAHRLGELAAEGPDGTKHNTERRAERSRARVFECSHDRSAATQSDFGFWILDFGFWIGNWLRPIRSETY